MHAAHPSTMMVVDDNMIRTFPIIQIEVKIRVPDQLIGRLIGKNGVCLKKIMDETATHISITEARQHEAQHYQTPELYDRIITIRGNNWNTVMMAEKNVQQKLRQFLDQDINMNANAGGGQQQYYHGPGVIMNPMENIGPYIAPGSVPAQILQRDNTYGNAAAYNALPMGVSPQSFYIQNPAAAAAVANYSIPTGQYGHAVQATVPNSVHIKSRVYVPNQIVGILIGTRGQTIKGIIAESGALISIEGDHPKKVNKQIENNKPESSSNNDAYIQEAAPKSNVITDGGNELDMKSVANVEPITDEKNGEPEKKLAIDASGNGESPNTTTTIDEQQPQNVEIGEEEEGGQKESNEDEKKTMMADHNEKQHQPEEVNGSPPQHNSAPLESHDCHQFNGNKRNVNYANNNNHQQTTINPDQRGVFIQGYEYQVNKALYWVFQKVAETQNVRAEEIALTCEAIVPSKVIGRIIGKQGQNVKQLQQTSGAHIKVPDDVNQHDKVDAAVRVYGNFCAVQHVQNHFGKLIMDAEWRESREYDVSERERRSRYRESSR